MSPKVLLRIAAGAITVFDLGHSLGGMVFAMSRGPEEEAILAALAAYRFDTMGSMRSHHDFYVGQGWYLSAVLTAFIVICWQLSNFAVESPKLVGRLSLVVSVFFGVSVALCAMFFFVAPLATSAVASAACAAAFWRLRSA
jgi:hypothetical protein